MKELITEALADFKPKKRSKGVKSSNATSRVSKPEVMLITANSSHRIQQQEAISRAASKRTDNNEEEDSDDSDRQYSEIFSRIDFMNDRIGQLKVCIDDNNTQVDTHLNLMREQIKAAEANLHRHVEE